MKAEMGAEYREKAKEQKMNKVNRICGNFSPHINENLDMSLCQSNRMRVMPGLIA